ncbi:MAG: hypothetical protein L6R39_003692 [Caloplaca ligustica]|nr:MAG: hypothetical protein L6R39_003692 [Caloplaca ligustica]
MRTLKASRPIVWASSEEDFNPFARKRKPSIYPEPVDEEAQIPPDSESFVAELIRRGTRRFTFAGPEPAVPKKEAKKPEEIYEKGHRSRSKLQPIDEERPTPSYQDQAFEAPGSKTITWKQRGFLLWRLWRSQAARIGLGSQWEVKPAIADIATSTITFASLSSTGQYFLPASPRPQQTTIIEYDASTQEVAGHCPLFLSPSAALLMKS